MGIVKQDVLNFASQLSTLDDNVWVDVIRYANEIDLSELGETDQTTRMARIYLAAHIATIAKQANSSSSSSIAAGPVISEAAGLVRRTYAAISNSTSSTTALSSSRYGQMYLEILTRSLANGPIVI